jgi:hypothetical protein
MVVNRGKVFGTTKMPFTPFHFGLGAALKGAARGRFSFLVFCFAQVVMDTEVLVYMARGGNQLHGFFHTYLGALAVGFISVILGWPLCRRFLRWWSAEPHVPLKQYYAASSDISIGAAFTGAFVGSFSHVLLDSFMHGDMRPQWPFSEENQLFGAVSAGLLHLICFLLGIFGVFICARGSRSA